MSNSDSAESLVVVRESVDIIKQAQEVVKPRAEVVAQQEEASYQLNELAAGIQVSDKELSEIDGKVDEYLSKLKGIDIYKDEGDLSDALSEVFNTSEQRRAETKQISSALTQTNYKGLENTAGYDAVNDMRDALEQYDPSKFSLLAPERILGFIPMPGIAKKRLKRYARKFQTAETHINQIMDGVDATREDAIRAKKELEQFEKDLLKLAKGLKIQHETYKRLDSRLGEYLLEVEQVDKIRARKISEDLIFKVKQERLDTVTILNHAVLGSEETVILKKTQEMVKIACERAVTNGRLILQINQSIAGNAYQQKRAANLLSNVNQGINTLTRNTADVVLDHAKTMQSLSESSLGDAKALQDAFKSTRDAFEVLNQGNKQRADKIQSAIDVMETSLAQAEERKENEKEAIRTIGTVIEQVSQRSYGTEAAPVANKKIGM